MWGKTIPFCRFLACLSLPRRNKKKEESGEKAEKGGVSDILLVFSNGWRVLSTREREGKKSYCLPCSVLADSFLPSFFLKRAFPLSVWCRLSLRPFKGPPLLGRRQYIQEKEFYLKAVVSSNNEKENKRPPWSRRQHACRNVLLRPRRKLGLMPHASLGCMYT